MSDRTSRFSALFAVDKIEQASVHIIGCGSVGGALGHLLARSGVGSITLWDPDTVAIENLGVQPFRHCDLGRPKAEALAEALRTYSSAEDPTAPIIQGITSRFSVQHASCSPGVIFSCVDNMVSRSTLFKQAVVWGSHPFFDARVAGFTVEVYHWVPGADADAYRKTLFPDEEMLQMPCGTKMTPHAPQVAASFLYHYFASYVSGRPLPRFGVSLDLGMLNFVDS